MLSIAMLLSPYEPEGGKILEANDGSVLTRFILCLTPLKLLVHPLAALTAEDVYKLCPACSSSTSFGVRKASTIDRITEQWFTSKNESNLRSLESTNGQLLRLNTVGRA